MARRNHSVGYTLEPSKDRQFPKEARLNIGDLTIDLANVDFSDLLSDWYWRVEGQFAPLLMTAFGDLFLRDPDGQVWFLDLVSGEFTVVANDTDEWAAMFDNPDTADEWLMPGLVYALIDEGMRLEAGTCYGYRIAPVLGGKIEPDNIEVTDLSVHFAVTGQIHEQVKDLPPGTPVSAITIDGAKP